MALWWCNVVAQVTSSVEGFQEARDRIRQFFREFQTPAFVTVGIHEDEGLHESDDITNAQLGATLHFGASIDHPGGTPYGYATEQAAERGEVRFLRQGEGYAVLGETGPHQIDIPARPWLDIGVEQGNAEYLRIIESALEHGDPLEVALERVGVVAVANVQRYMIELRTPPNAASTIRQKGSSNPLVDSGALVQSVTSQDQVGAPEEGL